MFEGAKGTVAGDNYTSLVTTMKKIFSAVRNSGMTGKIH